MIVSKEEFFKKIHFKDYWTLCSQAFKLYAMQFVGLFVVPIALILVKNNELPKWAWYWGNDKSGINGNSSWAEQDCSTPGSFWCRYKWLALRNPARNYAVSIGVHIPDAVEVFSTERHPVNFHCRSMYALVVDNKGKRFPMFLVSIRLTKKWTLVGKFGWKLWDVEKDYSNGTDVRNSFVFYPQIKTRCEDVAR